MKKPILKDLDSTISNYIYWLNEIDLFNEDAEDDERYGIIANLSTIWNKLDDFVNHTYGDGFYLEPINCSNAVIVDVEAKTDKLNAKVREVVHQIDNAIDKLKNIAYDIRELKAEYEIIDGD